MPYIRDPQSKKLVDVPFPKMECPTKGCSQQLKFIREQYQRNFGDVAWILDCGKHTYFVVQGCEPSRFNRMSQKR